MLRDLKGIWDGLDKPAQEKLEAVTAKAVERYLPADNPDIAPVRAHLLGKDGTFVERISLAALHPGTKAYLKGRAKAAIGGGLEHRSQVNVPNDIMVVCNNCGMSKAVHLHDDAITTDDILPV
jgi:hypothetical protein